MKEIDFDRALMLMEVQAKCAAVGVMNTSIAGEAGEELKAINEDCRQNALERADERRREEMDRETANQAKLRADNPLETESSETHEVAVEDEDFVGDPDSEVLERRS